MPLGPSLRAHPFTSGFTDLQLVRLASIATEVTFEENEIVFGSGERSRNFYLITQGSVAVELRTPQYAVCVQALGPNQVFGWSALLHDHDTLFQVRAREHVAALRLDGARLDEICQSEPQLGLEIYRRTLDVVAGRVKATEERFAEMCGVRV